MAEDLKRTMFAQQAVAATEMFDIRYRKRTFGPAARTLVLGEPDGPSTDGGRKARQPIVLGGADGRHAVAGFLDVAKLRAEIKPHAVLDAFWQGRYHEAVDVPMSEWAPLVADMNEFFRNMGFEVRLLEAPAASRLGVPGQRTVEQEIKASVHARSQANLLFLFVVSPILFVIALAFALLVLMR